ncbi:Short-chain dehydrogenase TIC 32, chloroplastic, partial [Mucuna pruriens]
MWWLGRKGPSGFSASSTAEEVTQGIDGTDLTAIVTGATSGIGVETARVLALRGVHVVMGIRNMAAGGKIKEAIIRDNPTAKIDLMELDLSSLESVRKFASQFNSHGLPLNILVYVTADTFLLAHVICTFNNAGIMATPFQLSKDYIELQFATNHVGHFLLTNLLLQTMKQTAIEQRKEGRIVNVSSRRHKLSYPEGIRFDKINDESGYNSLSAYGQSKLANVLHANELARRLKVTYIFEEEGTEITANSVSPGPIATNLFRYHGLMDACSYFCAVFVGLLGKYVMKNIQQGAATTCYVALHPQVKGLTGCYFADSNIAETSSQAVDTELARKLWECSSNLVNLSTDN